MVALSVLLALVGCGSSVSWELLQGDCVPTGEEIWYDGVDQDCDGNDDDQDGDGVGVDEDCWDDPNDATFLADAVGDGLTLTAVEVFPGAEEAWYDGVDQDCDGASDFDQDGDGFESANDEQADGSVGDDCVDGGVNDEVFEDSCSGELITVDPEDAASVNPDAEDALYDGVDQNCDGADDHDADGDGYAACDECDDTDAQAFPSDIPELWYDCADQNCDGNDGDYDGDGYVDAAYTASCIDWATINPDKQDGDCWDDITDSDPDFTAINGNPDLDHADVHPDAEDIPYDGVDAACDGDVFEFDADQDGFYSDAEPDRSGALGVDCNDDLATTNPSVSTDTCWEGEDNDCDAVVDEGSVSAGCYLSSGGELVISELFIWGDATTDPYGEWFEVYNPHTTRTVYMESMTITRQNTSSGDVTFTVDDVVAVAPQDTVVFCYEASYLGGLCDFEYGTLTGTDFALTQSIYTTLVITTTASDSASRTIDSVNYDGRISVSAAPWPGVTQGYSYELKPTKLTASGNDIGSNWCETTGSAYYTSGGNSDYGTPNAPNTCP
ncbi:MAG: hypothetical protein IPN01_17150 [Deltaproteobacteria bacterium]|nr:hypothetical protein [Deltaproteobacteria bacterium]